MKHVPFSSATPLTFSKAKIKAGPLTFISNKIPVLQSLCRQESVDSNRLTVDQTKNIISLIRAHVSFSVSTDICILVFMPSIHFQTEAGCRILVNAILLHVVSNISGTEVDVSIIPEFRMAATRFEYAATSYGGVVDFLIVKGPPASIGQYQMNIAHIFFACSFYYYSLRVFTRRTSACVYRSRYGQTPLVEHLRSQERRVQRCHTSGCHGRSVILPTTQVSIS